MQTTGASAYAMVEALVALPPNGGRFLGPSPDLRHRSLTLSTSLLLPRRTGSNFRGGGLVVRASGNTGDSSSTAPLSPLQFESPVGQFLEQILQSHPHLLPAAIDQQLENLETDRQSQKQGGGAPSSQDPLYKRIAEVRENEKKKALEEIIYSLIVQKFLEKGISMIPRITTSSDPGGRVDFWPNQQHKLESVHSPEVLEMVQSHLSLLLGDHQSVGPLDTIIEISKIKVGKLYAASIMYGYFLRRIDQRFQLDRAMNTLPEGYDENRARYEELSSNAKGLVDPQSLLTMMPDGSQGDEYGDEEDGKTYRLRSYVMYLDAETLQRYATVRSKEAVGLIEKQTQALFGRPEIMVAEDGSLGASNDEAMTVAFSGLTMLVLEAVTFGSFMWDSESYVESKYQFLNG
ncbi:UV-B-induced protein At3g17800, chloroplastic [Linum grandiflorum]